METNDAIRIESTPVYLAGGELRTLYVVAGGSVHECFYEHSEALALAREESLRRSLPVVDFTLGGR